MSIRQHIAAFFFTLSVGLLPQASFAQASAPEATPAPRRRHRPQRRPWCPR
jgi:hypothetical protein